MKIIYRIIDKNNSDDDCLYELMRADDLLYWAVIRYTDGDINYPTLHFESCRNLNCRDCGLAGTLIFEPGDLYEHHS